MKKIIALVLVGAFVFSLPVSAATSPVANTYNYYNTYNNITTDNHVTNNYNIRITVKGDGTKKIPRVIINSGGSGNGGSGTVTIKNNNNTVSFVPGLDCPLTVGQGGKLIINCVKTRAVLSLFETTSGAVSSAKVLAAQVGGTLKSVVDSKAPGVRFSKAQVNFYTPGVQAGDIYKIYQMGANGTWQEIQVDEVRQDHIVATIYKAGTLAFIKMN